MESRTITLLIALSLVAMAACAGDPEERPGEDAAAVVQQAIEVRTAVALDHVNPVHSPVTIERFGMPNARVMFVAAEDQGRTVAVSAPVALTFDVASGEVSVDGPRVELPGPGAWDVRLHLYPAEADGIDARTVVIDGTWDANRDHGEPSPLPWREMHSKAQGDVPDALQRFTWSSSTAASVDLATFVLDEDATDLVVAVPLDTWVSTVLVPVLRERFGDAERGPIDPAHSGEAASPRTRSNRGEVVEDDGIGLINLLERVSAGYQHRSTAR